MNADKAPRPDSKLKRLPEQRQEAIIELMMRPEMSLRQAVIELRKDGIVTSRRALSEFRKWWELKAQFNEDAMTVDTLLDELKQEMPKLTEEELDLIGNKTFSLQAIRNQDLKGFAKIRAAALKARSEKTKKELKERELALEERRVALLEQKAKQADETKKVLTNTALTPDQQRQRILEIFGHA